MFKIIKKVIKNFDKVYNYIFNKLIIKIFNIEVSGKIEINGRLFVRNNGSIKIGDRVIINSKYSANPIGGQAFTSVFVKKNAKLFIANGAGISNTAICVFDSVTIGENVYIGGGCKIYDTDFHSINYENRISKTDCDINSEAVEIKKGAFIGAGSIILKGVTIGEYSVIGAGSVVTKNIPDNELWAGNPARFIRKIR